MSISYQVRRSRRVKTLRIVVTPLKVEVVAPLKITDRVIQDFVQEKQGWIIRSMEKLQQREQMLESFAPEQYVHGVEIPFRGDKFPLSISETRLKKIKIEFDNGFLASIPEVLLKTSYQQAFRESLVRWMKKQALSDADKLVQRHAGRMELYPRSIRIKTQKSRWGSCGIRNDINLNWLLILAPPEVFEYVIVHELCHIQVRNHSSDFWALVALHLPDYREQKSWLKKHGGRLMLGL